MGKPLARASLALLLSSTLGLGCGVQPQDGDGTAEAASVVSCPASVQAWGVGVHYNVGDVVSFKGAFFQCRQAHTTVDGWFPDIVPALWNPVTCGGATPPPPAPPPAQPRPPAQTPPTQTPPPATPPPVQNPPPVANGATEFAPYVFAFSFGNTSAFKFSSLANLQSQRRVQGLSLAFVIADGGACRATQDIQRNQGDINAFRNGGGKLKASFGGALGTYLENACATDVQMADVVTGFVNQTGITDLDFDVEQPQALTADINAKRARALRLVQQRNPQVKISFTVQAIPRDKNNTPGGMTAAAVGAVQAAKDAGVKVSIVNLMTMDYGAFFSAGRRMGDLAVSAATDEITQLQKIFGINADQAAAMVGITPMLGTNDVTSEVFSADDARTVVAFAKQRKVGLLSFWAINRDQVCGAPNIANCSGINTANFQFTDIFSAK
jgi:hypothetical protein